MIYYQSYGATTGGVPYGQGMTTVPGVNDDWNGTTTGGVQTWCDGALWQYVGLSNFITMYMCIDSSPGAAKWIVLG